MTEKIMWELPLTTVSEANSSEHWTKSSKRHRQQQFFVRAMFHGLKQEIPIPCTITLTRLNCRGLDKFENLPMAFKYIKDEIALCILPEYRKAYVTRNGKVKQIKGHGDEDPRLHWKCAQEKSKTMGIRIEIEPYFEETFDDYLNDPGKYLGRMEDNLIKDSVEITPKKAYLS